MPVPVLVMAWWRYKLLLIPQLFWPLALPVRLALVFVDKFHPAGSQLASDCSDVNVCRRRCWRQSLTVKRRGTPWCRSGPSVRCDLWQRNWPLTIHCSLDSAFLMLSFRKNYNIRSHGSPFEFPGMPNQAMKFQSFMFNASLHYHWLIFTRSRNTENSTKQSLLVHILDLL